MVEFVGQSSRDGQNPGASTSRLLNIYRQPVDAGGRTRYALKSVLGTVAHCDLDGAFLRAMATIGDNIHVICQSALYRINADATVSNLGAVTDGEDAVLTSADGSPVMTVGGKYYHFDGALTEPTPGAFSAFGSVAYIAGYTVLTELGGRRFQFSGIADPSTLPGLSFATAEATDADLVRGVAFNGVLWLFKADSYEGWVPTGGAGAAAFERATVRDVGLRSFGGLTQFPGGVFFVGNDGRAHLCSGQDYRPVSTPAVETAINDGEEMRCFFYEDQGQAFCVIRFRDSPAWCFDIATGDWHERAEGVTHQAWGAIASCKFGRDWYIGTSTGKVNRLDRVNVDESGPLSRRMVSRTIYSTRPFRASKVQVFLRQGIDAVVRLRTSRNDGNMWSTEKARETEAGQYVRVIDWKNLGQFDQLTIDLTVTDAVDVPIWADGLLEKA